MKKGLCISFIILCAAVTAYAVPAIAVIDFDSGSWCTIEEAAVMTDAFRNELVRSGKAAVVTRNRLDSLKNEMRFQMSDWADAAKIKQAGRIIGADNMVFGRFGTMGGNGYLQVEMTDVETARIIYSARMMLTSYREFDRRVNAFVREFTSKIPNEPLFTGTWTAHIPHDGIIDTYAITFSGTSRLAVTITSLIDDTEIIEKAQGTYSYDNGILGITVFLRNSRIPHIANIQWSSVVAIGDSNTSFNMLAKPTSASENQIRVTFTKE